MAGITKSLEGWWFAQWGGFSMSVGVVSEVGESFLVLEYRNPDDFDELDHVGVKPLDKLESFSFYPTKEKLLARDKLHVFLKMGRDEAKTQ